MLRFIILMSSMLFAQSVSLPAAASEVTCTDKNDAGVTPWGDGAWAQITADSGAFIHWPEAISIQTISAADQFEIDLGYGAAGHEVAVATVCFKGNTPSVVTISGRDIPQNSRIVCRIRSLGSDGKTIGLKLMLKRSDT